MKKFLSILLAVMMVLSTVSFAAPSLAGNADAAVEVSVDELYAPEEEAVLAADGKISDDVDSYGELIFELNFNNVTSISGTSIKFTDAGYINPVAEQNAYLSDKGNINFADYPTYAIKERAAGDKYLEVSGGTGYAKVLVEAVTERGFQTQDGVYTLTADVYRPDNMPITTRFSGVNSENKGTEDTPIQDFEFVDGGWGKMKLQHDASCFGNGGHADIFSSIAGVRTIKFHRNGGTDDKTVGYDNIRLYYKPLTVDVTVKANGKTMNKTVSTLEAVSIADLAEELGLGVLYSVTGASVNGKAYATDASVVFAKDSTVELTVEKLDSKYIHETHGIMIYDIDFEKAEIGTDIPGNTSDFRVGAYATPIASKVMSHDPSEWHLNDSGFDLKVMADPVNANNKVAGVTGATSTVYPVLELKTWSNGASARYGFIEQDDLIWTVVYDYYDTTADGIAIRFGGKSSRDDVEYNGQTHPQWTTFEDTPTDSNTGRAASTWYSNIGVMTAENYDRMGGSSEISFLKMHAASPTNADLYYDNIRLYYRPAHVDVTFADSDIDGVKIANKTLTNVSTSGLTVSALLTQAGVDYSEVSALSYTFKGVEVDGEVYGINDVIGFLGDSTVSLVFEKVDMSEWQDENGIILYEINFDSLANGTQIESKAKVSTFGRVNPYVAGSENWYINISQFSSGIVENGALKFEKTADGQWAQIQISNEESNPSILISDGTITKFADMKIVSDVSGVTLGLTGYARKYNTSTGKWEGTTSNQNSVKTQSTVVSGEWYSLSGSKTLEGQEYNSESCTIFLPTYPAAGGIGDEFYLDNLKLYWKPANVNLTVYGGSNADYDTVNLKKVSTTASIDEVIALLPGSAYGKITGLADMEGNKLTSLNLVSDASFVAIWTPWVEVAGGQEFAEDKKGISANSMWAAGGYAYAADVGDGGADTTTVIHEMYSKAYWSENGNFYRTLWTPQIGDQDIGEGDTEETVQEFAIPAGRTHYNRKLNNGNGGEDCIRENINVSLAAANDAEYIVVRYRYTGLPNLAEVVANCQNPEGYEYSLSDDGYTIFYTDRWGEAASATLKPAYGAKYYVEMQSSGYEYAGGLEFHKNELMVEGEWLFDMIPVTEKITTNGAKTLLVQHVNLFNNQVVEFDYVRFVKLADEEEDVVLPDLGDDEEEEGVKVAAPTTLEESSEIRMDPEDVENYDMAGLRFKATIDADTKANAVDIGFIVAGYDKFMASHSSYDELTFDLVNGTNVKAGYIRQDGTANAGFYDTTDDNANVIAAYLYGIDPDHYASYVIVRPFVKANDKYYYGNAFSICMYDIAAAWYDGETDLELDDDTAYFYEDVVYHCRDNGLV